MFRGRPLSSIIEKYYWQILGEVESLPNIEEKIYGMVSLPNIATIGLNALRLLTPLHCTAPHCTARHCIKGRPKIMQL